VLVTPGGAVVHDGHRDAALDGAPDEAKAREHGERRADDEEELGALEQAPGGVERRPGHAAAEEDDIGREGAAARTGGDDEAGDEVVGQIGVPIGREDGEAITKVGIELEQALLQGGARRDRGAGQAAHTRQGAVELDDGLAAGGLVQAVDVLGDDAGQRPVGLERGERIVPALGLASEKRGQPMAERAQ